MDIVFNGSRHEVHASSQPLESQGSYYLNLLSCLGYDMQTPPLADLLKHYHSLAGNWLIASPVHWEATHNDAMLVAAGPQLELSEEEARSLFGEISQFLHSDNFKPVYHDACTWLFNSEGKPALTSKSLKAVLNQSITPTLRALDRTLFWQRLITELQMFLSEHPLNKKRENKLPINGIWFWGEGMLDLTIKKTILTDDELLFSLAKENNLNVCPIDQNNIFRKNHLIVINDSRAIDLKCLEKKIQKFTAHWYWNNMAYTTKAKWWLPLWR